MPDHILPRFHREANAIEAERAVARATRDHGPLIEHVDPTSPAGRRALRGIPVAGGATGTSPGTDPLFAMLEKERSR